ncbi:Hypothetical predicted protein [Mytilus galloprovincialis]|uniref:Tyr recombinase domain-containing protein n=1 Tax=Mytilus galloprovincialis TaxID=29158 RepID=A0A8B6CHE4_MYTGA|nr:Hypothetical predicted protein [Mytilus galloprovincialis]
MIFLRIYANVKNKSLKKKSSKVPLQYSDSDSDDSIHVPKVKSAKAKKFKKSGSSRVTKHKSRVISESSDSSDYDSFESSTDDDTSSTSGTDSSCKKKSLKKRKVKSGMVAKASDDVQNPQTWPHTTLQYEYINKSVSFQDLDLKLFVAGELEIIGSKPFDIDSELLCTYSEFLSRSFRSAQSIRNYLNGVKVLFLLLGLHVDVFSSYELKLTMKGLDRKLKHLPKQAFPITLEILGKIREHLNLNTPLDATYWCLFLFALLLLSRKSNLVPVSTKKFDKNKQLCRGDVTVFPSLIIVAFKWTKTIQLGNRILRIPLLAYPLSKFCPVNAYKRMCSLNPCTSDDAAFSYKKKGKCIPITYNQFQNKLRELLCKIGLNPNLFSSHSFRRGGATLASKAGVSPSSIQLMGDWKSNCYTKYIVSSLSDKINVAEQIKDFVLK